MLTQFIVSNSVVHLKHTTGCQYYESNQIFPKKGFVRFSICVVLIEIVFRRIHRTQLHDATRGEGIDSIVLQLCSREQRSSITPLEFVIELRSLPFDISLFACLLIPIIRLLTENCSYQTNVVLQVLSLKPHFIANVVCSTNVYRRSHYNKIVFKYFAIFIHIFIAIIVKLNISFLNLNNDYK